MFPADFILIAALNPCPCGYRNDPRRECHCSVPQIERYMAKISGPLLDRIDLHLEVPAVPYRELSSKTPGTSSEAMREDVQQARKVQSRRFHGTSVRTNSQMQSRRVRQYCELISRRGGTLEGLGRRTGPLGPGPRQDPARRSNDRRSGGDRCDRRAASERGDQLPVVGSAVVDVRGGQVQQVIQIGCFSGYEFTKTALIEPFACDLLFEEQFQIGERGHALQAEYIFAARHRRRAKNVLLRQTTLVGPEAGGACCTIMP